MVMLQTKKIKFLKTHPDAVLPERKHTNPNTGDSGYDMTAVEDTVIPARGSAVVPVGLTLASMPEGVWGRIESRSGTAFKHNVFSFNGIIDNSYTGDLGVKLINHSDKDYTALKGDRIAQFVLYPLIVAPVEWTDQVDSTERGANGFGSTGR